MSNNITPAQLFNLQSKMNYNHDNEMHNLINYSVWDIEELEKKKFKLHNESNKTHFKILRGIKQATYNKI